MAETPIIQKIDYYFGLVKKHRWLLIVPFCIAMVVGIYLAVTLPKIYETSTLILVTDQRVPSDYVQSIVTSDIESRINTISQTILSRSNLEKIIKKYDLFSDPDFNSMLMEEKLALLRQDISVSPNLIRGRRSRITNGLSITVKGPYPEKIMKVTNDLAGLFIQENLRMRQIQSVGTSEFLADELVTKRQRLVEVEQKLREYRRQYMGELPEQLEANLRTLERLQTQLSEKEESLCEERSRLTVIESQISANRNILTASSGAVSENGDEVSLEQLKAQLTSLKSNYTDRHPDVIKLKAKISDFESKYKSGQLKPSVETQSVDSGDPAMRLASNAVGDLTRQRLEARGEIENLTKDIAQITSQIRNYRDRVEKTPQREQELITLKRDYENIQESYTSLLNRKLESEIAVNMEKKQKGEQFRIVEHALLPRIPVEPDMRMLFMMSVAAGLGFGGGLIFLLDFLSTSLKQPKDYETELGLTVLAIIPKLVTPRDIRLGRINGALTFCSLIVAVGLAGAFGLLILKGVDPMLDIAREFAKNYNIPFI